MNLLRFESYQQTVEGLREFGLVFNEIETANRPFSDEEYQMITIDVNEGFQKMKAYHLADKGTKLL